MDPSGEPLWVSDVRPGSTHDLTAAPELVPAIAWHYTADMTILGDGGHDGAGCGVLTPVPHRTDGIPLHVNARAYNRVLVRHEAPCDRVEVEDLRRRAVAAVW